MSFFIAAMDFFAVSASNVPFFKNPKLFKVHSIELHMASFDEVFEKHFFEFSYSRFGKILQHFLISVFGGLSHSFGIHGDREDDCPRTF